jgi:hypothetical protein
MSRWRPVIAAAWVAACVPLAHAADPVDQSPPDNPSLVTTPRDATPGKIVQSPQGTVIGTVHEVLPEPSSGRPAYLLIATDSGVAPLPYWAVSHLLRDAHIVIDRSLLAEAPRIPGGGEPKNGDSSWKRQADSYWSAFR